MSDDRARPLPLVIKAMKNAIPGSSPLRREGLALLNHLEKAAAKTENRQHCLEGLRAAVTFFETDLPAPEAPEWPAVAEKIYMNPKAYLAYLKTGDKTPSSPLAYSLS